MATLIKNYIGGEWASAGTMEATPVYNPSRGEVIAQVPAGGTEEVNQAVAAARAAFPAWSEIPVVEPARILFRYKHLLEENFESVARGSIAGFASGRTGRPGRLSWRRIKCRPWRQRSSRSPVASS